MTQHHTAACTVDPDHPVDGTAYACKACADRTARRLRTIADLAPDARDVAYGLVRYGAGGRRADIDAPLPGNLAASTVLDECASAITTWVRHVMQERAIVQLPAGDPLVVSARYLIAHLEWLRHQPYAAEAFDELADVGRRIVRLADRPPERQLVGVCECGSWVYGRPGAAVVQCRGCEARYDAAKSRDTLRHALDDQLFTAAQIATFAARAGHDRRKVRRLVTMWAIRGVICPELEELPPGVHGPCRVRRDEQGHPRYRLGDVMARLPKPTVEAVR